LLSAPNPDDPLDNNAAEHWKRNEADAVAKGVQQHSCFCFRFICFFILPYFLEIFFFLRDLPFLFQPRNGQRNLPNNFLATSGVNIEVANKS